MQKQRKNPNDLQSFYRDGALIFGWNWSFQLRGGSERDVGKLSQIIAVDHHSGFPRGVPNESQVY
jgi:hypothetical protein